MAMVVGREDVMRANFEISHLKQVQIRLNISCLIFSSRVTRVDTTEMVNYGGGKQLKLDHRTFQAFTRLSFPDEVSALVIDIGTSSLRAGYAGDDTPKAIIPSSYGYYPANPETDVTMSETANHAEPGNKFAQIFIGHNGPSVWRAGMEIGNPLVEGLSTWLVFYVPRNAYSLCFKSRISIPSNHLLIMH